MNLKEFLDYRRVCPICNTGLSFYFHSNKQQKNRYEEDRMLILFDLNGLKKKHIDYKVGYSFGLNDSSFCIEFYTKDEKRFEGDSPLFLIDRFKELDKNLKGYRLHKKCSFCRCYWYFSDILNLSYKYARVNDIQVEKEYFGMTQTTPDNKIKVFRLLNHNHTQESFLSCFYAQSDRDAMAEYSSPNDATHMALPLIQFVSKEETMERIKKLLVFS